MRVLLVAHRSGRAALRRLLEQEPVVKVVADTGDTTGLLVRVHETRPDIVLLDWELPGRRAADTILGLRSLRYPPRVVAFAASVAAREKAIAAGADAFVSREDPFPTLLSVLHAVAGLSPRLVG